MVTWKEYSEADDSARWDEILLSARDYTVFQSYGWGEYKRASGWQPLRYLAFNKGGKVIGMAQLLLKSLPFGIKMAWAPGGPVVQFKETGTRNIPDLIKELFAVVRSSHPRIMIRFHSHLPHDSLLCYQINQVCRRPFFKLNSGYTIHMNLEDIGDQFTSQMTSKHRYYVKKALQENLSWTVGNGDKDIATLVDIHSEMVTTKNMQSIATTFDDIEALRNSLGKSVKILTGYSDETPVTSCLTLNFGAKSIYMIAATGSMGRRTSAAYAMVAHLIPKLLEDGVIWFDFGGLDPVTPAAAGVNHFKRGFGGKIVEYTGEWEVATSEFLRRGINFALSLKGGRA